MSGDPRSDDLCGSWALRSATATDEAGRSLPEPYGPAPMGRIVLTPRRADDGRALRRALVAVRGHEAAYASFCGSYRIEGDRLITRVDAALVPDRIGGEQVRRIERRGDALVLYPPRRADGAQRTMRHLGAYRRKLATVDELPAMPDRLDGAD